MQRVLFILIPVFLAVASFIPLFADTYPLLTQDQLNNYYSQEYQALTKAENIVSVLQTRVQDTSHAPQWTDKLELQNAIVQLEVKRTLFANFKGTESLRSQLVRDKLLQVLNNPNITEADLAELQSLVLQEKANIRAANAAAAPAATTTTPVMPGP